MWPNNTPPTAATSITFKPVPPEHCPSCGSKRRAVTRPVETRRPGPKGAGRGTRKACEDRWHFGAAS